MSDPDKLADAARRAAERDARGAEEREVPLGRRLAQVGVLGWLVVTPMLLGAFVGRWLDRMFHSGIFLTAPLMILGLALGCWIGWRWMHQS